MLRRSATLRRHTPLRLALAFLLLLTGLRARAETFKAPALGPTSVAIGGAWQFHTGDDLAWANPAFDDSGWQALKADEPWGAQGHRGYIGYAWYRRRMDLAQAESSLSPAASPLGLFIPAADGAYEVFWNGKKIGSSGSLPPHAVWWTYGKNAVFSLGSGAPLGSGAATGEATGTTTGVLALRFWVPPAFTNSDPADGGLHAAPRLGRLAVLQQQLESLYYRHEHHSLPQLIAATLIGAAGLLALLLFLRELSQWLYLWLALFLLADALFGLEFLIGLALPFVSNQLLIQIEQTCIPIALWLILLSVFGLNQSRRWRLCTAVVIAVFLAAEIADSMTIFFNQSAGPGLIRIDEVTTQIYTFLGFYVLFLVGFGLARRRSWSLVPLGVATLLYGLYLPLDSAVGLVSPAAGNRLDSWSVQAGDYRFNLHTMVDWSVVIVLTATVILQQIREARRQAHIAMEIKSAQEVQQVLIPEEIPTIPGLAVASVYKPASEVGGDFFQVIPLEAAGEEPATLVVVGDVSGKGLKAAMTVALIVGAMRTLAETTRNPAAILAGINRRLIGRTQGGFATCVALRIDANGDTTLANAGHLPPFRDGKELPVTASLPLGLTSMAEYENIQFRLNENETLTFITDGVLEARNHQGELYGFKRVASLMAAQPDVHQVVDAACTFGQEDDITVVSVKRTRVQPTFGSANGHKAVGTAL